MSLNGKSIELDAQQATLHTIKMDQTAEAARLQKESKDLTSMRTVTDSIKQSLTLRTESLKLIKKKLVMKVLKHATLMCNAAADH